MKRILAILFAILSLSILFGVERGCDDLCGDYSAQQHSVDADEFSFSQGDNFIDLRGRQGSSSTVAVTKLVTKNASSRRHLLDVLSGVRVAVAGLISECGYSYSCGFPFDHQPQKGLFIILRNIRI